MQEPIPAVGRELVLSQRAALRTMRLTNHITLSEDNYDGYGLAVDRSRTMSLATCILHE